MRFRRRGVIHIAADIAVVVFGRNFARRYAAGISRDIFSALGEAAVDVDDFGNVFRSQKILCLAFAVFAVCIDEHDVPASSSVLLVHHQHASRDAGAVEQPGRQANDGFKPAAFDEVLASFFFFATAKQHAMRHDGRHFAICLEYGQHVLHEHQVGLLAFLRHPDGKASGVFDVFLDVVLAEGWVGEHTVITFQLVGLCLVLRTAQGIFLPDVGVRNAVQQHVHLADRPGGTDALLSFQH
ncbi:hypothetical protein GALL_468230 [mine drainage metagenome]|uniref:Uncharacterized protein n=1 Tax=mine drainage metagenome TaxID=410659 RepID=A0A1J5PUW9_9ZZZZ